MKVNPGVSGSSGRLARSGSPDIRWNVMRFVGRRLSTFAELSNCRVEENASSGECISPLRNASSRGVVSRHEYLVKIVTGLSGKTEEVWWMVAISFKGDAEGLEIERVAGGQKLNLRQSSTPWF